MSQFLSHSEDETAQIAARLANTCQGDEVFLLHGTLGAGKSVFARAFVQSLTAPGMDVPSPTFTLVQTYDTAKGPLWHFDLYRLEHPDEIFETGWEEAMASGIVLVEWPERLGPHIPQRARRIVIEVPQNAPQQRKIEIDEPQT